MSAIPKMDPADYYTHKADCHGGHLSMEEATNRMGQACVRIVCEKGCGYRLLNLAREFQDHPHHGSPFRCRDHHAEPVSAKGRGCRKCAHDQATRPRKAANEWTTG